MCSGPLGFDGYTFFKGAAARMAATVDRITKTRMQQSPIWALSCDVAGGDLVSIVHANNTKDIPHWEPPAAAGGTTRAMLLPGLLQAISEAFAEFDPQWKDKAWGFTADGASVHRVRRAMGDSRSDNVAEKLVQAARRRCKKSALSDHLAQKLGRGKQLDESSVQLRGLNRSAVAQPNDSIQQ